MYVNRSAGRARERTGFLRSGWSASRDAVNYGAVNECRFTRIAPRADDCQRWRSIRQQRVSHRLMIQVTDGTVCVCGARVVMPDAAQRCEHEYRDKRHGYC